MSAPFYRIFLIVLLAHVVLLSVLWVGFPVQNSKAAATFFYEGAFPVASGPAAAVLEGGAMPFGGRAMGQVMGVDRFRPSGFNHWIELRGVKK